MDNKENILNFCRKCTNRKFDTSQGIVCGLTNQKPYFESECDGYIEDVSVSGKTNARYDELSGMEVHTADKGVRFLTFIIDVAFFYLLIFVTGLVLALSLGPGILNTMDTIHPITDRLITALLLVCYYIFFEAIWGRTIGKFIVGTKVVDKDGNKPDFGTIIQRSFCRIIPFDAFSFLGRRGWHDSIPDTWVVSNRWKNN
jgi:uncharacterized RDD family membrane protein YckC